MSNPYQFYTDNIRKYSFLAKTYSKKIYIIGSIRLVIALSAVFFTWFFWADWGIITSILLIHIILFGFLLKINSAFSLKKEYSQNRVRLNQDEIDGLNHTFSAFDGFSERIDMQHPFSSDLDIFGNNSLFQAINRTKTFFGKEKLANWFEAPLKKKDDILKQREAIRELASMQELALHFRATAMFCSGNESDSEALRQFSSSADLIKNKKRWKIIAWIFPATWISFFILASLTILSWNILPILFIVCLIVSFSLMKKINKLNQSLEEKVAILTTYSSLLAIIENENFSSDLLINQQADLLTEKRKSSVEIKKLSSYLRSLELRKTFPAGFLLNVFLLWEINYAIKIEEWKKKHANVLAEWMDTLANFDALCSLAAFAYNHPEYVYPEIADHYFLYQAKQLGHPLLKPNLCVRNDVDIPGSAYFLIITGANMAGKSTYLRTIGVNFLLGCLGLPVCAEKMTFYPAQLSSSLRTTDSLSKNESYFFAELKRLSVIIKQLQDGEELFIILDEILKGTNSVDKQKGSWALIKQFLSLNASGIIATHDLSLGKLMDSYPEQIRNYCFDAEIENDELHFSYQIREGIAQNMNACFLMKKMGIIVDKENDLV